MQMQCSVISFPAVKVCREMVLGSWLDVCVTRSWEHGLFHGVCFKMNWEVWIHALQFACCILVQNPYDLEVSAARPRVDFSG